MVVCEAERAWRLRAPFSAAKPKNQRGRERARERERGGFGLCGSREEACTSPVDGSLRPSSERGKYRLNSTVIEATLCLFFFFFRSDWEKLTREASERAEVQEQVT